MDDIVTPFRRLCNIPLLHNHGRAIDVYPCPFYRPCPFHHNPSDLLIDLVNQQIRHGIIHGTSATEIVEKIRQLLRTVREGSSPEHA